MGNFRNGWAVIGPQCVRDLGLVGNVHTHVEKDNHILTGLSGFPITSHFRSSSVALDWSGS